MHRDSFFTSRAPIMRRESVALLRMIQEDDIAPPYVAVRFTREVVWLRETESQAVTYAGSRRLENGSTYNDFYGLLTSAADPVRRAIATSAAEGWGPGHPIRVEVLVTIRDRPALVTSGDGIGGARYIPIPGTWIIADAEGEGYAERMKNGNHSTAWTDGVRWLDKAVTETQAVAWSSARSDEENLVAFNGLFAAHGVGKNPPDLAGMVEEIRNPKPADDAAQFAENGG
jgi:hypothetical protein